MSARETIQNTLDACLLHTPEDQLWMLVVISLLGGDSDGALENLTEVLTLRYLERHYEARNKNVSVETVYNATLTTHDDYPIIEFEACVYNSDSDQFADIEGAIAVRTGKIDLKESNIRPGNNLPF